MRVINKYAPIKKRSKVGKRNNPWITNQLLKEKRRENYLKRKACKTNTVFDWENYKQVRNCYNRLVKSSIRTYYSSELNNRKGNIKSTWNTINHLIGKHPKSKDVLHIQDEQNNQIDSENILNAFKKYFTEIGNLLSSQIGNAKNAPEYYITGVCNQFLFP